MAGHPLNLYLFYSCNRTGSTGNTPNYIVQCNIYSILEIHKTMYILLIRFEGLHRIHRSTSVSSQSFVFCINSYVLYLFCHHNQIKKDIDYSLLLS